MTAARRRLIVTDIREQFHVSQRRASRAPDLSRSCLRYTPVELQSLLETDSIPSRFNALIGRLVEWEKRIQFLAPFRPPELDATRN